MPDESPIQIAESLGPVDHLVVEFPSGLLNGEGFATLIDLVERGVIYVLDLEFVERAMDGTVRLVDASSIANPHGVDLSVLGGASSGLLDADDLHAVGEAIVPGALAAVLVYENLFAERLATALGRSGGRVVSSNLVSVDDLIAALERVESTDG